MRGWIYIISNSEKKGLLKVGFSPRDPQLQAEEFASAAPGAAGKYTVEYDVLVRDGETIEGGLFLVLDSRREPEGWLRMTPPEAIALIRAAVGDKLLIEHFPRGKPPRHDAAAEALPARNAARTGSYEPAEEPARLRLRGVLQLWRKIFPDLAALNVVLALVFFFMLALWLGARMLGVALDHAMLIPLAIVLAVLWTYPVRMMIMARGVAGEEVPLDAPGDAWRTSEKTVIMCPKCTQRVRVPRGKRVLVLCPACKQKFPYAG